MTKLLNPMAAGIDISSRDHYVAVPKECYPKVRIFQSFTPDLHRLAQWLCSLGIKTVAMESTGVYWYHLYTILLDYDLEVYLVNAKAVKHVPGRKSDVNDAQWLQYLHACGLLNPCFQPDNLTRSLRCYVRERKNLIQELSRQTQRMQKALEQMNIKLANVINDITGKTGRLIIEAIIKGERDPQVLAKYRDRRIKASPELLLKSLEGNWREEQIFCLEQAYKHYSFLEARLKDCDLAVENTLGLIDKDPHASKTLKGEKRRKNQPNFNVNQHLYDILGVDVTQIWGLKNITALTLLSETGPCLKEKFPTEKQFLSWLNVVPNNKITGGKLISSRVPRKKNRAGQALREAANGLWNAKNPLGDYLRKKKARSGAGQAIVSTARKIASIYYKLVTEKIEFRTDIMEETQQKYWQKKLLSLEKAKEKIELQLITMRPRNILVI